MPASGTTPATSTPSSDVVTAGGPAATTPDPYGSRRGDRYASTGDANPYGTRATRGVAGGTSSTTTSSIAGTSSTTPSPSSGSTSEDPATAADPFSRAPSTPATIGPAPFPGAGGAVSLTAAEEKVPTTAGGSTASGNPLRGAGATPMSSTTTPGGTSAVAVDTLPAGGAASARGTSTAASAATAQPTPNPYGYGPTTATSATNLQGATNTQGTSAATRANPYTANPYSANPYGSASPGPAGSSATGTAASTNNPYAGSSAAGSSQWPGTTTAAQTSSSLASGAQRSDGWNTNQGGAQPGSLGAAGTQAATASAPYSGAAGGPTSSGMAGSTTQPGGSSLTSSATRSGGLSQAATIASPQGGQQSPYSQSPYTQPGYSQAVTQSAGSGQRTYVVGPNDNYWSIAETVYGNGAFAQALAEHHRNRYPNGPRVGDVLDTPSDDALRERYGNLMPPAGQQTMTATASTTALGSSNTMGSPPQGGRLYTVREGDTLFDIARAQLGKAGRWNEIYQLNRAALGEHLELMQPGMQLVLPADGPTTTAPTQQRGRY